MWVSECVHGTVFIVYDLKEEVVNILKKYAWSWFINQISFVL